MKNTFILTLFKNLNEILSNPIRMVGATVSPLTGV